MTESGSASILFVDLDGTLVRTDMLCEALVLAGKRHPLALVRFLVQVRRGRAAAKRALAQQVQPDPARLPYHQEVLAFLRREKARGRTLVLATASDQLWADAIAGHVHLFDDVLASDGRHNLKGSGKLQAIQDYCRQHGVETFAYIGDAMADLPIWKHAAQVYVVAPTRRLRFAVEALRRPTRVFGADGARFNPIRRLFYG